jgi:hypothetical protein
MVAHTGNPTYLGGGIKRIVVLGQYGPKVSVSLSQRTS